MMGGGAGRAGCEEPADERMAVDGGRGCTLTVTEHGEVYQPLYRAVSHYLTGEGATVHRYLGALADRMATR